MDLVPTTTTAEIDIGETPELESLSSGSEPEDDYYEAPEVPPEHIADAKSEEKGQNKLFNVAVDVHEGAQRHDSSREQQLVDSVEREFIMVNYPTNNETGTWSVPVSTAPHSVVSGEERDTNTQRSTGTVVSRVERTMSPQSEEDNREFQRLESSDTSNQAGFAESGQNLATNSQVMTEQVGEGAMGEQYETRGEVAVKESSHSEEETGNINIPSFESLGLLYAKSSNLQDDRYLLIIMPVPSFN